jgi:molecular chaperone IbpA
MTRFSISPLYNSTLGFENIIREIENFMESDFKNNTAVSNFPPHNILKVSDNVYVLELAVAGFSKNEIDISVKEGELQIKGDKLDKTDKFNYLHRGIATRSFTKTIKIANTVEVRGANYSDGILSISLENVIPESKKPRKIMIGDNSSFQPQLLTEQVKEAA